MTVNFTLEIKTLDDFIEIFEEANSKFNVFRLKEHLRNVLTSHIQARK